MCISSRDHQLVAATGVFARTRFLLPMIAAILLLLSGVAMAQVAPENPAPQGGSLDELMSKRTLQELWLTCLIGIFGLIVICTIVFSVRRIQDVQAADITRPIIIVMVIVGALILVTAGYSNQQIAPAFGLLGTIVGYILGRSPGASQPSENQGKQQKLGDNSSAT